VRWSTFNSMLLVKLFVLAVRTLPQSDILATPQRSSFVDWARFSQHSNS
jgi:hypothetical protein